MDCSIIIVNYNTKELTDACINSIIQYSKDIAYEIILVDNNSTDGSSLLFAERKDIKFIEASQNLGFGRANNLGAKQAKGKYLFFLNSDTLLLENSIKEMVAFFENNGESLKIGALGCILVDKNLEYNGCGSFLPTCASEIKRYKTVIPFLRKFNNVQDLVKPLDVTSFEVGYVIGADLMMRSSVFNSLGGFDSMFFMYYEESDLQKRMKDIGYKAWIYTKTKIIHLEDGSGKQVKNYNNRKRIIVHTSKNLYLKKNDAESFRKYVRWDRLFLMLNRFNKKYTKEENEEYIAEIKKTYL
ncbi:glycosyltransferase family 2 protein [Sphingobacterium oryzagri]|uniref:Glycosyltransferase family 2 protein n=1 Tax=Sphingobacterium oryzagri TaxID=3025669 RepID=A0ABY7WKI0_9SPHI|nr:glycosyltransferase family 2 protein [Sphingobacterium sp. KACC 22765]WDF68966.1 glycosyltransferase family 2 protein [Sphingobacterium sp. KACC 22765]